MSDTDEYRTCSTCANFVYDYDTCRVRERQGKFGEEAFVLGSETCDDWERKFDYGD